MSVNNKTTADIGTLNPFRYRSYYYDTETGLYYLQTRYYDPETGRFINSDSLSYLGNGNELSNYNLFAYCSNNPVMGYDPEGNAFKWWQSILAGVAVIAGAALITAAIVTTGGSAAAIIATAGKIALAGLKTAALAGVVAGTVRSTKTVIEGGSIEDTGKSFITGFSDGFLVASLYASGSMIASGSLYKFSGMLDFGNNKGYGWSLGSYEGGYQTPKTPGISVFTHNGGINGGRSFGLDLDVYNGLHFHTNKFGLGRKSKWIKAHHWWAMPVLIGVSVGLSEGWSEW